MPNLDLAVDRNWAFYGGCFGWRNRPIIISQFSPPSSVQPIHPKAPSLGRFTTFAMEHRRGEFSVCMATWVHHRTNRFDSTRKARSGRSYLSGNYEEIPASRTSPLAFPPIMRVQARSSFSGSSTEGIAMRSTVQSTKTRPNRLGLPRE